MYDVLPIYVQCRYIVFITYGMFYLRTICVCDMFCLIYTRYIVLLTYDMLSYIYTIRFVIFQKFVQYTNRL
jgi:hypothetical protein